MRFKFVHYFVPSFLIIYLVISFLPRTDIFPKTNEIFPFFCFDLYSNVPNELSVYDLRFNYGEKNESYLYFKNYSLNKIEEKFYRSWVSNLANSYNQTGVMDVKFIQNQIDQSNSVELVKFQGSYKDMILYNSHDVIVIKKIK